eukprot:GHVH01017417.1.p1 GENE.GHVH01017417.1~~GHVH01017417.1.p1  ORF type:complete len:199 (+),score=31.78 GHVH01017417.1:85-681(+)
MLSTYPYLGAVVFATAGFIHRYRPLDTGRKQVVIRIEKQAIFVSIKGQILIDEAVPHAIDVSSSFWTMDEDEILLNLFKIEKQWWSKAANNTPEIDVTKCIPKPVDFAELDQGTQMNVERMIEKEKRGSLSVNKANGDLAKRPQEVAFNEENESVDQAKIRTRVSTKTVEEQKRILEQFKAMNPEFDFSGATVQYSSQ